MSQAQTLAVSETRFASVETLAQFVGGIVDAASKHAKAERNLVGSLIASARLIGRAVSEDDWSANLATPLRKALKAKVGGDSVKVYVSHAKTVTLATCGRPPVSDALPLGKHWADQKQGKRPEGVNAYVRRVSALLKLATPNEFGHLILPEGYSLAGDAPQAAETPTATPTATDAQGSAGQSADAEGGLNVSPEQAKADNAAAHARAIMGSADLGALLLKVAAEHREELVKFLRDTAKAAHEADAAKARDLKRREPKAA